ATNAIAAISLVGSLVVAGSDYSAVPNGWVCTLLGFVAVTCSSTNAFGGFLITDRMLRMFKTAEDRARATRRPVELQAFGAVAAIVAGVAAILYATKPAGMAMGEYLRYQGDLSRVTLTALDFEVVVGGLTFTGSLIAAAKLQELLRGRPITYRGQNLTSLTLLSIIVASGTYLVYTAAATPFFYVM